jgi:hypothetical protein
MGRVRMRAAVPAAAEAAGGEKKNEADDGESPDDQGFLDASASHRESRIHTDGGDHDVHGFILTEGRYKVISETPPG